MFINTELTHLDSFAGSGGFTVAAEQTGRIKTIQAIDNDPDAQLVWCGNFPNIPIFGDIKDFRGERGKYDIITCGFPCTGTSNAGTKTGLAHPESALWREGIRLLIECRPRFFVVEQPDGVVDRGLRAILGGLRMAGYSWDDPQIIKAEECGAGHRRPRLFIISYPNEQSGRYQQTRWPQQMREMVERARASQQWLRVAIERASDGRYHGLSPRLVQGSRSRELKPAEYSTVKDTPGRIRARYLAGRAVTPAQARIVFDRVLYLHDLG
ncbi:DNA cytosine methyltransferase [Pannus brasiliensis CCIBt3594]|uniref:DNA (cytosine-5-)-methyltransferase n=1 Tax=Pannus brasiliensis CCIBt3594 TaxID=1427578 RepID=A0AAW9QQX1_9CHRO